MREGSVDGLSIGFRAERARGSPGGGGRVLERVDLWEISLVTFPLLPGARVHAVERTPLTDEGALAGAIRRAAQTRNASRS